MLFLCIPECCSRGDLGDDGTGIDMGGRELVDELDSCVLLLFGEIKDSRPIGTAYVVALPVAGGRVVNLKEEFQQLPVGGFGRIEFDKDRFSMRAMISIRRIGNVTARISNVGPDDTRLTADEFFYAPKAASG